MTKRYQIVIAAVLLAALCSCAARNPTTAQAPQITVLQITRVAADANNVAAHTVAALWGAGKLSIETTQQLKGRLTSIAHALDAVATIAESSEPWATQRIKIGQALADLGIDQAGITDPDLKAQLQGLTGLIAQILQKAAA